MTLNKIQLLEDSMINKIAAGEVVERPASVVKELAENSVDAGAGAVTVEIRDGGISLIRITDNGSGIPRDQVATAFMRHATSKIADMDDLENVITLGFRGEALSSVASVAQVELTTKTAADIAGFHVELDGGKLTSSGEVGCVDGTTVIVRNLFYNVPARRKFLKKPGTEAGYISDCIYRMALAHPEIAFKYINDNAVLLQTSGNKDLKTVMFHLYGRETAQKLLKLGCEADGLTLSGYIGKPELARGNRTYENFFINGRYIKSDILHRAAEDAYKTRLMNGRFPLCAVAMTIRPDLVDVNVHPAKLEVRFAKEDEVYSAVLTAFSETLAEHSLIPEAKLRERTHAAGLPSVKSASAAGTGVQPGDFLELREDCEAEPRETGNARASFLDAIYPPAAEQLKLSAQAADEVKKQFVFDAETETRGSSPSEAEPLDMAGISPDGTAADTAQPAEPEPRSPFFADCVIVGRAFGTYWIVEQGASLYAIDQHAAHERIIYEELLADFAAGERVSQMLLQPLIVSLTPRELDTVTANAKLFERFGFDVEEFGPDSVAVRAVPFLLRSPADGGFFVELVDKLGEVGAAAAHTAASGASDRLSASVAMAACKAAVRAGDPLNNAEARALIEKLLKLDNPFSCPHGRPTIIEITRYELEKKFKRIV